MKKIVLNVVVFSFSLLSLYAFVQLKNSPLRMMEYHTEESVCDVEGRIEEHVSKCISSKNKNCQHSNGALEETIPRFHQQLNTFVPF